MLQHDERLEPGHESDKGNKFGVEVKGLTERRKERLAEALATFISVDKAGASVAMGEMAQLKEVYKHAEVIDVEEVMTLRPDEQGTAKLMVNTPKIPKGKWEPSLMEEDWALLCQALFVPVGRRRGVVRDAQEVDRCHQKEWSKKKAGQRVAGLGKVAWEKTSTESFFSASVEQERAFSRMSALREALLSTSSFEDV